MHVGSEPCKDRVTMDSVEIKQLLAIHFQQATALFPRSND